ncbi:winged helix-turn-helix domain-containing protein [Pseudemcibacter aquimaris]|uniref:winged helix-turn-helix domain-containing protein n=1 Tax=Pseudemcibacter aquimaris TaxID=2857064 RepID=UPI00201242BA|nr:crosslink repair DNA glycosylase YcaQ family protein [Pseudemcibacter aquimaris]MCC3862500.1 winged helix DNA-binding domain-containing protein [Pseudemcibacter aquimaris]WDU57762.1 winged helix DNA-binding domain-containing protein [Pseudemcibacter aquimaris]
MEIKNKDIRNLWISTTGLSVSPAGQLDLMELIKQIGFVQLDTIQNVSRAHHHIIWSRNQNYQEHMLDDLLKEKGNIFEHFTHDASVIPVEYYPMWTRQFGRMKAYYDKSKRYQEMLKLADFDDIIGRITNEGALSTEAFNTTKQTDKMWSRPPHKLALDYMWYAGELATSHREKFKKFYDLSERVIPEQHLNHDNDDQAQINWLCENALDKLSFANAKEIKEFWDATDRSEVNNWIKYQKLTPIKWQSAEGTWIDAFAPADIALRLEKAKNPTSKLRILNPFDPAIRDRERLLKLFGFDYKIEIFVPAAKRKWGYYVYPILEGNRFIGRIDLKGDRKKKLLNVINFWSEPNVKWTTNRQEKLETELSRLGKLADLETVNWMIKPDFPQ